MVSHNGHLSGDDDLLDQAIAEFLRAESTGLAGDRQLWLDRFPACATGLIEYFDDRERLDAVMMPVRLEWSSSDSGRASIGHVKDVNSAVKIETIEFVPSVDKLAGERYHPLRFHARGGMGEIWLAEDKRIGRQVAIKKLRAGRKDRQARFMVEAQVTGQLEHPSVVPLHDIGIDDSGDPYYVMKFIQGRQLSDAIADFHAQKKSPDWAGDLQFRRLLETFVSICNAVAYAHSKGVLHRDIKPDNVMLGAYGETMVVDWGLAKVMGQPDQPTGPSVRLSGGASTATQDGAIVGSPLYMSPEGAEGRSDDVDQCSDVYLLGATLYEILTAKPPRQGSSQSELINLARKCRPVEPRKLDQRIPRSLEAICLKAMAFRKVDRYPTPLALADDIQRFLAGEPTVAYREPMLVRFGRWLRRHRRGILQTAAVLAVATLSAWAFNNYRQARMLVEREQAREQLAEFNALVDEAQFFAANSDELSERAPYYDLSRATTAGNAALLIAQPWGDHGQQLPLVDQRPEFLHTQYALLLRMARTQLQQNQHSSHPREALALLDRAKLIEPQSRAYHQLRSTCLQQTGDDRAAQDEAHLAAQPDMPQSADDHFLQAELLRSQDVGSAARSLAAGSAQHCDYLDQAVAEYRAALELDPRHVWARFQLGRCLLALGHNPEAIEALSACVALRPNSPWAYSARGLAQALSGHSLEALADLDRAVQLDSTFLPALLNRGYVHWMQKNADAALADFNAVLAAPQNRQLVEAEFYRGQILLEQHKNRDALADFSKVVEDLPNFRPAYWFQAQALFRLEKYENGQAALAKFIALSEVESKDESLAQKYFNIGKSLRLMALELDGNARQEALIRAVDQLQSAIAAGKPTSEMFQHLGAARELLDKPLEAIESYSNGLVISANDVALLNLRGWAYVTTDQFERARDDFSAALCASTDNAESHSGLGFVLAMTGVVAEARKEASIALLTGSESYLVLHNVACIYGRLSESSEQKTEQENLAITTLRQAIALQKLTMGGPDEVALIRQERTAFPDSLRSRAEFQRL